MPQLVRLKQQESRTAFLRGTVAWLGSFLAVAMAISTAFYLGSGLLAAVWLKSAMVDGKMVEFWAILLFFWMLISVTLQYIQVIFSPIMALLGNSMLPFGVFIEIIFKLLLKHNIIIENSIAYGVGLSFLVTVFVFLYGVFY